MELTLNKIPMEGYASPLDAVVYQEETQESIVPDACPDILTVVSTQAEVQLGRKECQEGRAEAAGTLRVTVLYLPDGEEGPRSLEVTVPFRCGQAAPGLTAGSPLVVIPRVTAAETRVLNPRKVLVRLELAVSMQGFSPLEDTLCTPWEEPEHGLQQRTEELESYVVAAAAEKNFAFSDEVHLSASHPEVKALLGHRLGLRCSDAKVIGSKLIFKGEAVLQVLYRTLEDGLATGRWELPFSQIMELPGVAEEVSCSVDVVERESQVTLSGDEECRTLAVHLELLGQAVVRETRTITLFSDAYSVTHEAAVERQSYALTQLWEESAPQETARVTVDTPVMARTVEDCRVELGQPQLVEEEGERFLSVQSRATVLYTGEDGSLAAVTTPVAARCRVVLPEGGKCKAKCALAGEPQAVATAGGIELRVPVQFFCMTTVEHSCLGVVGLELQEREEGVERPSVILRLAQPGECLWDIAKAYSTTTDDILAANALPDTEGLAGTMLLIPRSRA